MPQEPTTKATATRELLDTATETTTDDVYTQTHDNFTKFTCKEVYAFRSIATSNDYSESANSLSNLLQLGITVESPNGIEELIVIQPEHLLKVPIEQREEIVEAMFNEGEIWVGQHEDIFTKGLFPKTWGTIIAPTTKEVDDIIQYVNKGITNMDPYGVQEAFTMGSTMSLLLSSFLITSSIAFTAGLSTPLALTVGFASSIGSAKMTEPILGLTERFLGLDTPHLWAQKNRDVEDLSIEPINTDLKEELNTIFTTFTEGWTSATVIEVKEQDSTVRLDLFTEMGGDVTVTIPRPSDTTTDFLLNRIMNDYDISSVHMLEGKTVELNLSSLGREDDTTNENYRLRASQ